jgi:SAM-dependent methyltransferase
MFAERSCPACGGSLQSWRDGLLRCSGCGSAVAVPGAPPSHAYVQPHSRRLAAPLASALAVGVREQLRLLGKLPSAARILDLGAGDGRLAAALARAGHRVTAVEPFRDVVAGRGLDGVEVVRSGVQELELPEHTYDVVVLWHVLEHLDDPRAVLGRVHGWLAPRGCLLVGVPNLDSLQADLGGDRWFHLDSQRHLVHFTPAGLDLLLGRSGFRTVERRQVLLDQAVPGMWMTLLNRLTVRQDALRAFVRREPVLGRDLAVTAVAAAPLLVFGTALELAAAATGRGGALAVLAQPNR